MRFIHTSDWHIGRLFQNISLLDDQLYVLKQIKQYAKDFTVDALIVAGDIFDRSVPPAEAVDALNNFFQQVEDELNIPIIMISGNHDSAKRLRFGAKQMQKSGLHILADINSVTEPVIVTCKDESVAFYGIPYHDPVEVREAFATEEQTTAIKTYDDAHTFLANKVLEHKKQHHKDIPAVLLSHCFIDGASESDSERPLSIGGADRVSWQPLTDFDYVALGHLHGPQYKGAEHIRYSGSLMKYSFSEHKQKKGVTLVEINSKGLVKQEHLTINVKHDLRIVEGSLEEIINAGKIDERSDDYILAKINDSQVILDPIGRLRQVYPNVLQIERTNFDHTSNSRLSNNTSTGQSNERSESEVFTDFFKQVMDVELSPQQLELLQQTISEAQNVMEDK
ncbi:exonuclease SbcCD subunit D [Thalassomonas sp. M1454]|uniref:exonuclease SbcCD subunit D n=1 Tax=Thalassomonas sp. M1454 TaxID=2594477 RepID=UPI0011802C1E|nr:exonuclease SbcCD subunit D [Thalassomonas sp. M1454]TRX57054.1 exonuclease SbcCD subunit D [Thalassomonas sp. M1454]